MQKRALRHGGTLMLAAAITLVAAGCGPAPWNEPDASTDPAPTETAPPPVPNDLSSGSTERVLQAGAVSATVNYWSTLSMDQWTATSVKPVSISMVTSVEPNDGQKVYLQSTSMLAVPANATESFSPLDEQRDAAAVTPGYLVLDPYSYSQTFNVGAVPAEATHVTLQFTYSFLVQTTPTSKEFAKQTATDTVVVALAAAAPSAASTEAP